MKVYSESPRAEGKLHILLNFNIFENVMTTSVKGRKGFPLPEDLMNSLGETMTRHVEIPDSQD